MLLNLSSCQLKIDYYILNIVLCKCHGKRKAKAVVDAQKRRKETRECHEFVMCGEIIKPQKKKKSREKKVAKQLQKSQKAVDKMAILSPYLPK